MTQFGRTSHNVLVTQPVPFPDSPSLSSSLTGASMETAKAAAAFRDYCLMGSDRSLAKLAEMYHKNKSYVHQLARWSSQHHWQDRVKRYDEEEAEKRRQKRRAELEAMDERHANMGRLNAMIAARRLNDLLESGEINASAAVSLLKVATELERLARGAATSRMEGDVTIIVQPKEYVGITDDECGSEE